ncbi:uncharacterized protein B0J16DRAFT_318526 [Fusarium flagelliforme]|uniref:Uncharacterized protein n=1 Tax=Fusarium flagelliforme TaxID=2675880 RepID=A0A395MSQ5_9HYPO|nr:uncharacterized protein B0J16DRAFT_318526 [Fusarium flagelliforme]KAH7188880.1 hypothetical protein B0J16DRAFT_318526 [Fusarium flagelliforme]RFN50981.1 hypothetical protein FIE12Z_4717 [Fusarium flagelliforme]
MSLLSAFRVACTNLGCFGAPTNVHDAPSATWLLEHRYQRHGKPASTKGRTPNASLYRMYEYLVVGYTVGLRSEIEYFFNQPTWSVESIPDPEDADAARYAILAILTHYLVKAFNRLIERGLSRGCPAIIDTDTKAKLRSQEVVLKQQPSWVKFVRRLDEPFTIPNASGETPVDSALSVEFLAMNIIIAEPHVAFV